MSIVIIFVSFYHDDAVTLAVDPGTNFWDYGGLETTGYENPWRYGSKMAPFDQDASPFDFYFCDCNLYIIVLKLN